MAGKVVCFLFVTGCCFAFGLNLKLEQVLVLSRHNVRTPLTEDLEYRSPKIWPTWDLAPGLLTDRGALLEKYFGQYFSEWLTYHGILQTGPCCIQNYCPEEDSVFIYANTKQRTKETAKAFVYGAFRNCNVPVNFKNTTEMDPIFNPVIHNTTKAFREQAISEMNKKLNETDLTDVYLELNRIADIKNSEICKLESYCDLANDKDEIIYQIGMEPNVKGPLFIGASMVDAFLMSYYEGFAPKDIAWGAIKSENEWKLLMRVTKKYLDARFNLPKSSKDFAQPLLKFIKEILSTNKTFSLLVGHDSNLNPVITSLGFKLYTLPGQLELTPIGSKLVFQRWSDGNNDFLKVEFVYQSWTQIRNAEKLTLLNPPKNITMYFKNLVDDNGFYPWSEFERILDDVTEY